MALQSCSLTTLVATFVSLVGKVPARTEFENGAECTAGRSFRASSYVVFAFHAFLFYHLIPTLRNFIDTTD
jgi:hypothetical protein